MGAMRNTTRTYSVTVRPCTLYPSQFRWQVTSSDGEHTEFSPQCFATREIASEAGQVRARELERKGLLNAMTKVPKRPRDTNQRG